MKTTSEAMTEYSRLIAYGDSFVHGDGLSTHDQTRPFWERYSPDAWPHLLGNKLQIPNIINKGIQGGSNFESAHQMLRDVTELNINPTDLVYVLLSHPARIPIPTGYAPMLYQSNIHFRNARGLKFLQDIELLVTPQHIAEAWTLDAHNLISIIQIYTGCTVRFFWGWFDIYKDKYPQLYGIPTINEICEDEDPRVVSLQTQLEIRENNHLAKCGHWNERGHQIVADKLYEYEKANGSEAVSR